MNEPVQTTIREQAELEKVRQEPRPKAECGSCSLCCKLLGVPEVPKPPAQWCPHCKPGKPSPCTVYADRPETCRDFQCGWLATSGLPEHRPDRLHMIVTGESKKIGAYVIHVDTAYPDAPQQPAGRRFLAALMRVGAYQNIVLVTGDKRRFLGNDASQLEGRLRALEATGITKLD